jgi:hypothetical protein
MLHPLGTPLTPILKSGIKKNQFKIIFILFVAIQLFRILTVIKQR